MGRGGGTKVRINAQGHMAKMDATSRYVIVTRLQRPGTEAIKRE